LAVEAWTTYPDLLRTLPGVLPTEGAKDAYYERLKAIASNPQAREYARQEMSFFFRLSDFIEVRGVRRWSALSAADPDQAARNIFRALSGTSVEDRLRIEGPARREIVWTLVRLAWRPGAFADAAKALALLGEAENETFANNATSEFVARFQVVLGGTAVPYLHRLPVLDELVGDNRLTLNRLVIKALSRVGEERSFRMGSEPPSDELPEMEWYPPTGREQLQCVQAAFDRLTTLANRAESGLQEDFITAANEFVMMLRDATTRPMVERFFEVVRDAYPDAREPLRRVIAELVHRERKYWNALGQEELDELDALHARFEDASLKARLRQHVGQADWERDVQPQLRPLAKELLESAVALAEEWPWLTSGDAADAWRFGEALAEEDPGRTLVTSGFAMSEAGGDLRVLCGYISAWRRKLGDDWYDQWFDAQVQHRPRPVNLLFEIAWRCGATATVARHVANVLLTDSVAREIVGKLAFGKWGEEIEPDTLEDILRAMVDGGHRATALTILERRIEAAPDGFGRWHQLALELVTAPELIRSHNMTSYSWKQLAQRFTKDHAGEIAAAIFREQGDRSGGTWFAEHTDAAKVLEACVERDPSAVWAALLPHISTKRSAYRFSIGFPRGVVERVPPERVLNWIEEQPDERAPIIAKVASKDLSNDETLAARVLGAYGDKHDVASAFFAEFVSGIWRGTSSGHWEQLAATADDVAKRTSCRTCGDGQLMRLATSGIWQIEIDSGTKKQKIVVNAIIKVHHLMPHIAQQHHVADDTDVERSVSRVGHIDRRDEAWRAG
jgi:hypothetical protein